MKHARADYDRFQDPDNKIPADEPVMIFRAQDKFAAAALRGYLALAEAGGADRRIINAVRKHADAFDAWPVKKSPDL